MTTAIALVVAEYYEDLAASMAERARERAADRDAEVVDRASVPGVSDAPVVANRLTRRDDVDAVAVFGTVIPGDADRDQLVAHAAARSLSDVSVNRDTPVTFGVAGPDASMAEARERVGKAAEAVDAAVGMVESLPGASPE